MEQARYVVVSPMKNEEKYVRATLESMAAQTVKPVEWVIVNDGSTDRSEEIINEFQPANPWIRVLNQAGLGQRRPEHYGGHVVDLVHDGIKAVTATDYDFIVKLDCDVSFDPDFFETLLAEFKKNPKLGITSGVSFAVLDGELREEKSSPRHTLGATKLYLRKCFEDIGGLVPSMGWDGIDELMARMKGYEAYPLRIVVRHHRPEGLASGLLASGVERGNGSYFMGYHPLFMVVRAISRFFKPGQAADGVGLLIGYFNSLLRGNPRIPNREFIQFLRRNQLRKLLSLRNEI